MAYESTLESFVKHVDASKTARDVDDWVALSLIVFCCQ